MILLGGLLRSPEAALADDCRVGRTPEGVYPINDPDIVMVDEDVTIRLNASLPEWSRVECVFVFENGGPEKEVLMGFPGTMYLESDLSSPERTDLGGLDAYVRRGVDADWREVPVARETGVSGPAEDTKAAEYDFWYTFPVRFAAGERLSIRNIYRVANTMWSNGFVGTGYA